MMSNAFREVRARLVLLWVDDAGMSTVEYASVDLYTPLSTGL